LKGGLKLRIDKLTVVQLVAVVSVFSLFLLIPLASIVYKAFIYEEKVSAYWLKFVFTDNFYMPIDVEVNGDPPFIHLHVRSSGKFWQRIGKDLVYISGVDLGVIPNTLVVASLTAFFTTMIGVFFAFVFARYKFPGCNALRILLLIPVISTPFVGAIGLRRMISAEGVLNTLFYEKLHLLPFKIQIDGLAAVVVVQTLMFYPIVMLNAFTAFINIDPTLEEQAENMGASGFKLFKSITLPLALPGIEAGALLVFILSLEDLGTPIVFVGSNAEKLLTYQIFTKIFSPTGLIVPEATALAVILLVTSMIVFLAIRKYVSLRAYATISRGGVWQPRVKEISVWKAAPIYLLAAILLFFATLPHIGVFLLTFSEKWRGALPEEYTLRHLKYIFSDKMTFSAIKNSLLYSGAATLLIVVLGVSAAYLISRRKVKGVDLLDFIVTMPIAIPGIVIATGLFFTFLETPLSPIINPAPLLIAAYTVRKFPFTIRAAYAGLEQTHEALEEAALNLGAGSARVFLTIVIPLITANILAGAMLSFVYCMSEVSTSLVLGGTRPPYAPMTWKMYDLMYALAGGYNAAAAMGVLLMTLQFAMIVGSNLLLKKRVSAITGL